MRQTSEQRLATDTWIMRIFAICVVVLFSVAALSLALLSDGTIPLSQILGGALAVFTVSFFIAGILSFYRYRDASLIPRKRILGWVLRASLIAAIVSTIGIAIAIALGLPQDTAPFPSLPVAAAAIAVIFLALFISFLAVILFAEVAAFGVVGVMSAIERRLAPRVLRGIAGLANKKKLSMADLTLRWFFAIPDIVDTNLLNVHPEPKRSFVTWKDMYPALEWELLFGGVLALYISLNPFVAGSETITVDAIFSMMTNGAALIPFFILPWFAFQRLGAGIGGAKKEFTLFNGIRSRLLQTFFAIGTLLLIARVLISETDLESFVIGFTGFMFTLFLVSLICTFIYLNFFENELVEDITTGFEDRKPRETEAVPTQVPSPVEEKTEAKSP